MQSMVHLRHNCYRLKNVKGPVKEIIFCSSCGDADIEEA